MNAASHESLKEKLDEFNLFLFKHPIATTTFDDLLGALKAEASPQVIIFTGPTGVGKSTLATAACNRLFLHYRSQMEAEPNFLPVVTISAVPPNGSGFSWKDFYIRLLTGQHEPLVDRKLLLPRQTSLFPDHVL